MKPYYKIWFKYWHPSIIPYGYCRYDYIEIGGKNKANTMKEYRKVMNDCRKRGILCKYRTDKIYYIRSKR